MAVGAMLQNAYIELKQYAKRRVEPWDEGLVDRAFEIARLGHQKHFRSSGEAFIYHPLAVARIVADVNCDLHTFLAAILHDVVEDADVSLQQLREEFNQEVAFIVDSVTKVLDPPANSNASEDTQEAYLRKNIVGTTRDIRVAYIKLSDRFHNLATLGARPLSKRDRTVMETERYYAPLAGELGIGYLKRELDLWTLRFRHSERYRRLMTFVTMNRDSYRHAVNRVWQDVSEKLRLAGIQAKFIEMPLEANLMQKLQSTGMDIPDSAQGRGKFGTELDLLFSSIEDCYRALGVILNTWPSVSSEFRDWTAIPLPNGQQGIRCLVGVRSDDFITFRLKTEEMHRQSEWGPLFHIRNVRDYEEAFSQCPQAETLSKIAELDRMTGSTHLFLELLEQDLLQPKMRVFLANNGYFHLPTGATVLDLAFYIGLDTGCACRGAIVNERAVDVSFVLRDGDLISLELTDAKAPEPSWIYGKTYRTAKTRYAILNR